MQQPHQELAGLIDGNYGTRAQVEESNFAARPCYHPATTGVGPIFSSPLPSAIIAIVPAITAGIHQSMVEFASWLAMSPTCWQHVGPTAKCRHFWPTRPCRADTKLIPTQHFCVGMADIYPFLLLVPEVRMHNLPKTSTYVVLSTIR